MNPFETRREDPTDPVGLLLDCHQRIRHFLGMAQRLASAREVEAQAVQLGAESVARYFEKALPLHSADEDESVLPRLEQEGIECESERMRAEHAEIHALLDVLLPLWKLLIDRPGKLESLRPQLREPTQALAALFERHLAHEEAELFPRVRQSLDESIRRTIFREMRARRNA